jgi:vancomycin resistance protein YoaR
LNNLVQNEKTNFVYMEMKMKRIFKKQFLVLTLILCAIVLSTVSNSINVVAASQSSLDISGLSLSNAIKKTQEQIDNLKKNLKINVIFEEQVFTLSGAQLRARDAEQVVRENRKSVVGTNFFEKINIIKNRSRKFLIKNIDLFTGVDEFISNTSLKANRKMQEPNIKFYPKKKVMFEADNGIIGVEVDKNEFKNRITNNFNSSQTQIEIALPVILTKPTQTANEVVSKIKKRATFSTNYSSSVGGRRHNVLLSLSAFNGLIVKPEQVISFNDMLRKIPASSFKSAKIIVNGEFVDGIGGGMCQASSTLYNAVLLSGLETIKSYSHSLPVGYVKFGFDAMVNPGSADLVFKNNTDENIYIKAYGDNNDCFVEIYGEAMPKGLVIKRKSVNIGTIKHQGDRIIPDVRGLHTDRALFKGEFYRIKYPQEGYEARSYLQYWVDGELVEEKYLRYSRYNAQQGIVYEGIEDLPEGMEEVIDTMSYQIEAEQQTIEKLSTEQIEEKMKKTNPSHFNQ